MRHLSVDPVQSQVEEERWRCESEGEWQKMVLCLTRLTGIRKMRWGSESCLLSPVVSCRAACSSMPRSASRSPPGLCLRRAVVLSKFSRFEFEKRRQPHVPEAALQKLVCRCRRLCSLIPDLSVNQQNEKGQDWLARHRIQTENRDRFVKALQRRGVETKVVNRFEYNSEVIEWADVIFTAGGDGTFLMACAKINDRNKPIIGLNSDPTRSVGHLCIPSKFTNDFEHALDKLLAGDFQWKYRQRVRVTIEGEQEWDEPLEIHNQNMGIVREFRYLDLDAADESRSRSNSASDSAASGSHNSKKRLLPVRALNEVFVGESLSSKVTNCELAIDDDPAFKIKCSGITICTGTGSTSWSFNINKLTTPCVTSLVKIINDETGSKIPADPTVIQRITQKFNDSLIFDPSQLKMAYTIRDPIVFRTGYDGNPRGFADRIRIKSKMFDACVVLDGGLSYKFNDGAIATFEMREEDALKTIDLH